MGQPLSDRRTLACLLGVVAVGVLFAPTRGGPLSYDSYWYLEHAMRIRLHPGLETLLVRRPAFPAMIAAAFAVLGTAVTSAYVLCRLFFVANLALTFLLGAALRDRATGLLGVFFVLTSWTVNRWSSKILLDHVIVALLLAFLLLLHRGLATGGRGWYAGAGAVLAVAFLTKEVVAAPFLALPFLFLLRRDLRNRRTLAGTAVLAAAFAAVLVPLIAALAGRPESMQTLLGPLWTFLRAPQAALPGAVAGSPGALGSTAGNVVLRGLDAYLVRQFALWPFLAAAAALALYRAARRGDYPSQLLGGALLTTAPLFYLAAGRYLRAGQLLAAHVLLFLLLALAARDLVTAANRLARRRGPAVAAAGALVATLCAVPVFFGAEDAGAFADLVTCDRPDGACFTFWRGPTRLHGEQDVYAAAVVRFGLASLAPGERIAAFRPVVDAVPFYSGERIGAVSLESVPLPAATGGEARPGTVPDRLLYLTGGEGTLLGQFEGQLLQRINEGRVRYVVWTGAPFSMPAAYFRTHPGLRRVRSLAGGRLQVYRVLRRPLPPAPRAGTRVGPQLYRHIRATLKRGPSERAALERALARLLGWPPARVAEMTALVERGERRAFEERYTRGLLR